MAAGKSKKHVFHRNTCFFAIEGGGPADLLHTTFPVERGTYGIVQETVWLETGRQAETATSSAVWAAGEDGDLTDGGW